MAHWAERAWPWALFAALLVWGWRTTDLVHTVPAYGDALEGLWATTWYAENLRTGSSPAIYPLAFFPGGWHLATYAWGPANFVILLPLHAVGGAAFAYNVASVITLGLAFAGTLVLAQRLPWSGTAEIPAELVRPGANELMIRTAFGTRPVDATGGENPDSRSLSAGVTRLRVEALP